MAISPSQAAAYVAAIDYAPPPPTTGGLFGTLLTDILPLTPDAAIAAIQTNAYTQTFPNAIIREFQGVYDRLPAQSGAAFWTQQFGQGFVSLNQISTTFADTTEFVSDYQAVLPGITVATAATAQTTAAFVTDIFQNAFQRNPLAAGLAFWTLPGTTVANFLTFVTTSAEFQQRAVPNITAFQNLEAAATTGGPVPPGPPTTLWQVVPPVVNTFTLTQGIDTPTTGFSTGNGATATAANSVFNALPFVVPTSGLANNTLNIGDVLLATGAAAGATSLAYTTTPLVAANPSFAQNVTMTGVNQATITNAFLGIGGFQGANISGLLIENNTNSVGDVTLGGTGQGLKSLLTNINISGNGTTGAANFVNTDVLAASVGDATKTISHRAHWQPRQHCGRLCRATGDLQRCRRRNRCRSQPHLRDLVDYSREYVQPAARPGRDDRCWRCYE